jgi:hypothetical protein
MWSWDGHSTKVQNWNLKTDEKIDARQAGAVFVG